VVDEVLIENRRVVGVKGRSRNGMTVAERAAVVVGADSRDSIVAAAVRAEAYHDKRPLLAPYYAYWSGLPMEGRFETYIRSCGDARRCRRTTVRRPWSPDRLMRSSSRTCTIIERHYLQSLHLRPELAERIGSARRDNEEAMDGFAQTNAGTISPTDFLATENVGAIINASPDGETAFRTQARRARAR